MRVCVGPVQSWPFFGSFFSLLSRLSRLAASFSSSSSSQLSSLCGGGSCSAGWLIQALISISFTSGQLLLLSYIKSSDDDIRVCDLKTGTALLLKTASCCCTFNIKSGKKVETFLVLT